MSGVKIWLQWNNDSLIWGSSDYVWSEVFIMQEVGAMFEGTGITLPERDTWEELDRNLTKKKFVEEKKRQYLQIIARVNGLVTTEVKDIDAIKKKIKIKHIKKTFEAFGQKVEVTVKNIKGK